MKTRDLFFITFTTANLALVLYGLLALLMPGILLGPFLLNVYQFPTEANNATTYLEALFRLLGFFNIIPGMLGLLLLYRLRDSWQTWILRIIVASTALAYIGPIVFDNTVGSIGFFEIVEHIFFGVSILGSSKQIPGLLISRPIQ